MNSVNLKNKTSIVGGILLLLAVSGIALNVYLFWWIQNVSAQLTQTEEELAVAVRRNKEISIWQGRAPQFNKEFETLESVFVDSNLPVQFVKEIEENADESGVELDINIQSIEEGEEVSIKPINVKMNVKGDFIACLHFLDGLEHIHYLLKIKNLDISSLESSVQFNILAEVLSYEVEF